VAGVVPVPKSHDPARGRASRLAPAPPRGDNTSLTSGTDLPGRRGRLGAISGWRPGVRAVVVVPAVAVVIAMAFAVSASAADNLRATATDAALRSAEAIVRAYVDPSLREASLDLDAARDPAMDSQLERLVISGDIRLVKVWSRDGRIVYSNDESLRGKRYSIDHELAEAFAGANVTEYGSTDNTAVPHGEPANVLPERYLEIYVPIRGRVDGNPIGVYELYQDAGPIEARVEATRRDVFVFALLAASALLALLGLAFAGTSRILAHQNRLLRERADRDPLTGLANHGYLLREIDAALRKRPRGALAIVDIDTFRLLNDGYGYPAGDDALRAVARELTAAARSGQVFGRYGPDEFLVADFKPDARRLLETLDDLRRRLSRISLRFEGSEALPLTVSSGVAEAPNDGRHARELIGVAEAALREAKTGGGAAVKVADRVTMESLAAQNSTFGVLEGLVAIVDAKDRYTKFHSEDVTSHALLLAEALALDEETLRLIRLSGLLHDVGKVAIPAGILRKPGPLTPEEFDVVKQHVSLGDAIVGAVPQLADVRAGVRYHHERWDGTGYLAGLRGKEIPLVARVLAVADAYSAMTTTRPYRKALHRDVALERIVDAAGTQLDPELARRFVEVMEREAVAASRAAVPGRTAA
jgi:diguanylate cyclase (GGDEF)-like protein